MRSLFGNEWSFLAYFCQFFKLSRSEEALPLFKAVSCFNHCFFCCRAGNEPFTDNTEILENGVIRFMSVTGAEQGAYICTAENGMGTITVTANLRIQGKHTNWEDIDTREVMPPGGTHSIRLGDQTIFCGPDETAHALP